MYANSSNDDTLLNLAVVDKITKGIKVRLSTICVSSYAMLKTELTQEKQPQNECHYPRFVSTFLFEMRIFNRQINKSALKTERAGNCVVTWLQKTCRTYLPLQHT